MIKPYVDAVAERAPVSWGLPGGFGAFLTQLAVTAALAFSLGLVSFIRRERLKWVAAMPCLLGGLVLLPFVFIGLANIGEAALHRMLRVPDLSAGILMVLIGAFFLAWLLPRARARLAQDQEADGSGEKDARRKVKTMKLFGIATLIVGVVFILIHAFELF